VIARVTTLSVQQGKLDDVVRFAKNALQVIKREEQFRGYYGLADRQANKYVVILLWETEADLEVFLQSPFHRENSATLLALLAEPPNVETYEVAVHS